MSLRHYFWLFFAIIVLCLMTVHTSNADDDEASIEDIQEEESEDIVTVEIPYITPNAPSGSYIAETFDDSSAYKKNWQFSKSKKEGVDADISKYDGVWSLEAAEKDALPGDLGLVLRSKAKHAAISTLLKKPFIFKDKPFIVQYEVNFQNGQECGGAYIKLLSKPSGGAIDLSLFNDKTPYTIMFGPDKCGNEHKLHFIFRHVNPLNGSIEEKHAKVMNSGSLLTDLNPPVNPPKDIDDPEDFKPDDWDEREKIVDADAVKPDDWDEDASMQIIDPNASKPSGWLDDEPEMIPDPDAVKPDDWDDEMDGEWEAPLINNPVCTEAPGCGEWQPPMIDNPDYKGKWKAPMINNPNYQGKWSPRKIYNPEYFEDLEPFKMTAVDAVKFAADTFDLKLTKVDKGRGGYIARFLNYSNKHPWLYAVYVLIAAVPIILIFAFCCAESKDDARKKKNDESSPDDPAAEEETQVVEEEEEAPLLTSEDVDVELVEEVENMANEVEEANEVKETDEPPKETEEEKHSQDDDDENTESENEVTIRKSLRQRKVRKD